ncbi:DUF6003 family protein [Streptomyces sp. H39-S7]|uniref:DUF6003 family protein n=1 Tax=Streptomyces sp. H39-S7 TaxID=3004357 RepID=UPI0022AEE8B3|nr:DUF6003 family protein [Streptomyces sp. H39-S7]MCZ4124768.1 DUF6003 family protein [Streptomyces sp. H39-S7]
MLFRAVLEIGGIVTGSAFLVIVPAAEHAAPGVDAGRLPDLAAWDTAAVHGWLQAHEGASSATVRVVASSDADLIPAGAERLEVPVTDDEAAEIVRVSSVPPVAEARAELLSFRQMLQARPAMVARARAAGLSTSRIEQLIGAPAADERDASQP